MIILFTGRPGGGKSYETVRYQILPALLNDRRKVVTNIPLVKSYIETVHGAEVAELVEVVDGDFHSYGNERPFSKTDHYLKYEDWKNEKGQGVLFCIDEAHLPLGRQSDKAVLEFYSMHRHYGFDIVLMSQNPRKLNADIRDMVEIVHKCSKMIVFGEDGYVKKTYHGLPMNNEVQTEERNYDLAYFSYYQSHTKSDSSISEAGVNDVKTKVNPYSFATKIFLGLGILILCRAFYTVFADDENVTESIQASETVETVEPVNSALPPKESASDIESVTQSEHDRLEAIRTHNEKERERRERQSREYHPFNKVQLHVNGMYEDQVRGIKRVFFSASRNGQLLFRLELKDLLLAGYTANILGDCVVELMYFDYRSFVICDSPTLGVDTPQIAE